METINLTDIIDDIFLNCSGDITKFWAKELAKQCALEFGKQLLELAAENAKTEYKSEMVDTPCGAKYNTGKNIIDKQSILDTIKQVE